ncbi:hypothetical protein Celaphus_00007773, partial [Cervus elaphus hippelaphus]
RQLLVFQAPGTPIIARQVTPTTIIKQVSQAQTTVQPSTALQRSPGVQVRWGLGGAHDAGETMENVKKCKNFLSTLIKLASSGKQSTETAANVKELVQNLLDGKIEAEDFTSRLYRELNSSPQPYLVPFLKVIRSPLALPLRPQCRVAPGGPEGPCPLRGRPVCPRLKGAALLGGRCRSDASAALMRFNRLKGSAASRPHVCLSAQRSLPALRQLTPDSAAFIQQSQQQPPASQATTALTAVVLSGSVQRTAGKTAATVTSALQPPVISLTQPTQVGVGKQGQPTPLPGVVFHQEPRPKHTEPTQVLSVGHVSFHGLGPSSTA